MYLKRYVSYGFDVFKVNPQAIKYLKESTEKRFTKRQQKALREMAKDFQEKMGLEFTDNLRDGWPEKILQLGTVLDTQDNKLTTIEEIERAFSDKGEIQFFSHGGSSFKALKTILKPPSKRVG
jgi:hypothetical protein